MHSGADFPLLDEPTNNLEITSIETLEDALLKLGRCFIASSHDRYFLDRVCTRIIKLDTGIVRDFAGPFHYARERPEAGAVRTRGLADTHPKIEEARGWRGRRSAGGNSRHAGVGS